MLFNNFKNLCNLEQEIFMFYSSFTFIAAPGYWSGYCSRVKVNFRSAPGYCSRVKVNFRSLHIFSHSETLLGTRLAHGRQFKTNGLH